MKTLVTFLLAAFAISAGAQNVLYGPIVGGVTDASCRVFVETDAATAFRVELSTDPGFSVINTSAGGNTDANNANAGIVTLTGLAQNVKYYVRVKINNTPTGDVAEFRTFYTAGLTPHQVFLTGACINNFTDIDSNIFVAARNENARAFIQMGNWGYPDVNGCTDIYLSNPPTSWATNYSKVQNIYQQRYGSTNSAALLKSLPLDYVYDDHDYMNKNTGEQEVLGYVINLTIDIYGSPHAYTQPASARSNSILGYTQWFPGYSLPDTSQGIYHSFRSGNAEFFVLDTRSKRGPKVLSVDTVGNTSTWDYEPDPNSHILGTAQMDWLKTALTNSTATWKFIVSSVPFNVGERFALDTLLKLGNASVSYWPPNVSCFPLLPSKGFSATNNFADMWAGYKADGDTLLNYVLGNDIKNVFVLSGHSGTVGLDDGVNSGLPELMSGNMKIANSQDALLYQQFMKFNIWDLGGSGLCQQDNYNTTYGRVEIFGNDSIRLSAVDNTGTEVVGANFYANAAYKYNPNYRPERLPVAANDVV
ncbi:MAG TPA: alkaline phosphatase D family protein, partial [Chitinophagales bacterium]|nr:alkaline phosphatase D family protein [Chitinophagales bacterium]